MINRDGPYLSVLILLFAAAAPAVAATGEETYKQRCSLCHDSGATQAPRIGQPAEWKPRLEKGRAGLLRSALEGVRGTAMLPKAGFPDLGNDEVAAAVDYMIAKVGLPVPAAAAARPVQQTPRIRVDDATLLANVTEALRQRRVAGVTVEARDGQVVLRGMVESGKAIRDAEAAALGVAGVQSVENHLIGADLFEHD